MSLLTISPSPHVRSSMTTQKIMLLVVLALVPAIVAATVVFGPRALFMVIYCAVISMFTELVCQRLMQKEVTVTDGSAMLTGVLLALNLPVTLPLWEAAIGCVFAVAVVKQLFGGLGCNFANPAITGRVFLLLSFGGDMTTWVKPFYYQGNNFIVKLLMDNPRIPDGVTGATPLASGNANLLDLFLGNVGGSLGETSALALLIGGIFLLVMGIISWHTPVGIPGRSGCAGTVLYHCHRRRNNRCAVRPAQRRRYPGRILHGDRLCDNAHHRNRKADLRSGLCGADLRHPGICQYAGGMFVLHPADEPADPVY